MSVRLLAIGAVLALAACGSSTPAPRRAAAASVATTPAAAAGPSAADIAATRECVRFTRASAAITAGDTTVGQLIATLNISGTAWAKALTSSGDPAKKLPGGPSRPNKLAVDMSRAGLGLSMVGLDGTDGQTGKVAHAWHLTQKYMRAAAAACAKG